MIPRRYLPSLACHLKVSFASERWTCGLKLMEMSRHAKMSALDKLDEMSRDPPTWLRIILRRTWMLQILIAILSIVVQIFRICHNIFLDTMTVLSDDCQYCQAPYTCRGWSLVGKSVDSSLSPSAGCSHSTMSGAADPFNLRVHITWSFRPRHAELAALLSVDTLSKNWHLFLELKAKDKVWSHKSFQF